MSKIAMEPKKEKKLVNASRKDKSAFGPIYEHYHKYIQDFFKFRVSEQHTAEELTSKTFEKALKGIDNFQWQGLPFSSWLFRIARNTLIDYYRKTEKRNKVSQLDENVHNIEDKQSPHKEYETMIAEDLLHKVLNELPSREREIIYMKFFDGYTNRLIAQLTGLTETNVGTIVYRTLRKLREVYSEQS